MCPTFDGTMPQSLQNETGEGWNVTNCPPALHSERSGGKMVDAASASNSAAARVLEKAPQNQALGKLPDQDSNLGHGD
jgi:hypothetical protein